MIGDFFAAFSSPKDNIGNPIMRLRTLKAETTIINEAILKTKKKYEIKIHLLIPIERIDTAPL